MRRKIDDILNRWAAQEQPKPLLIRGARRVGKTYAIKRLGEEVFGKDNFVYCDFQTDLDRLTQLFSGTTDVARLISELELLFDRDIHPRTTLVAFDEVQLCEKALNSLRFFAESEYRVIATGSQLGVTLRNRALPFPSDIEQVSLQPLDFEEFLWACGKRRLADGIRAAFDERRQFALHDEALSLCRSYLVVGGMPRVVSGFAENKSYDDVRTRQADICQTYVADIALYSSPESAVRTQAVWESIPNQLARETSRKFKYADVASGGRERMYRAPLAWLEAAGLVLLNPQTNDAVAPLMARGDGSFFKVYLADTGLMFYRFRLSARAFLDDSVRPTLSANFRGALAENYVMQALTANKLKTYYWTPGTTSQNEIEFVIQNNLGQIIPIEVKSGSNVRSKSLAAYANKCAAPVSLRLSEKNFGLEGGVYSIPLYAAFCIDAPALEALS